MLHSVSRDQSQITVAPSWWEEKAMVNIPSPMERLSVQTKIESKTAWLPGFENSGRSGGGDVPASR